jgi:hypothetical protein
MSGRLNDVVLLKKGGIAKNNHQNSGEFTDVVTFIRALSIRFSSLFFIWDSANSLTLP